MFKLNLTSGLFRGDEMADSRRNITAASYSAGAVNSLTAGNFLTGFLLLLHADDAFLGLMTMAVLLGNTCQVFSALLLERFRERKKLLIAGRFAVHLLNIVLIALVPLFPLKDGLKLSMVFFVLLLVNLISAVITPGFSIWHIKSIPESMRARYFSFINISSNIVLYLLILGASRFVDFCKASGREMDGLLALRAAAFVFCLVEIVFLFRVKEYPNTINPSALNPVGIFVTPIRNRTYMKTVLIGCLWSFTASIPGPYFVAYLLKDVQLEYSFLNFVNLLNIPLLLIFTPLWARRIQHTSWFRTLAMCMAMFLLHYIGLAFVTRETLILYPVFAVLSFVIMPGITLAMSNIPFVNIPEENQTNFFGFYSTAASLAALLGVTAGRSFIGFTAGVKLDILGITLQNKQLILLLTAAAMLFAAAAIFRLQKEKQT